MDIKLERLNAQQEHALMFSKKQMIKLVKIIYQLAFYQEIVHVQQLKQEHVTLMKLQELMLKKQHFAIDI